MEQDRGHTQPDISRLLQLPREVRDLILEHVLVRGVIPIECAVSKSPPPRGEHSRREPRVIPEELYPLRSSWAHRRVWSVPTFDIGESNVSNFDRNIPDVHMTYQIGKAAGNANLALLRVCKQIYAEASKIFYSRNVFSFASDFRIPSAFTFLCDRPAASLLHIRSLELALTEATNMSGTGRAHYPVINRSTDSFVLQFAYQYFTELCTLMSTSRMRLRQLYLTLETLSYAPVDSLNTFWECILWEKERMRSARPWTPIWLDPLLQIQGLELLEMRWISTRPQLLRMEDTVLAIQQNMLKGFTSRHAIHTQTAGDERFVLKFQFLQQDPEHPVDGYPTYDDVYRDIHGSVGPREDYHEQNGDIARFKDSPYCIEISRDLEVAYASLFELKSV